MLPRQGAEPLKMSPSAGAAVRGVPAALLRGPAGSHVVVWTRGGLGDDDLAVALRLVGWPTAQPSIPLRLPVLPGGGGCRLRPACRRRLGALCCPPEGVGEGRGGGPGLGSPPPLAPPALSPRPAEQASRVTSPPRAALACPPAASSRLFDGRGPGHLSLPAAPPPCLWARRGVFLAHSQQEGL